LWENFLSNWTERKYLLKTLAITCGLWWIISGITIHIYFICVDIVIFIIYFARFHFYNLPGGLNFVIRS
jgi:dolichol kinase